MLSKNKNAHQYSLSLDNLPLFIDVCTGPNGINTSDSFQQHVPSLIQMLQDIHDFKELEDNGTKIKITKIINKLKEHYNISENNWLECK